jgi:hypothetical protein
MAPPPSSTKSQVSLLAGLSAIARRATAGERPISAIGASAYAVDMNLLVLVIVLLLLFGGGGFYIGGPAYGGGGLGLVLLICVIVWLFGGFGGGRK